MGYEGRLPAALVAVRHGESTANAAFAAAEAAGATEVAITSRDADIPLTPLGRRQAAALGRRMAALPAGQRPQSVWCSPYERARQTAGEILAELGSTSGSGPGSAPGDGPGSTSSGGLPVRYDERLRDRELGVLEMLTAAAIDARHPAEAARRRRLGELYYRPPGGESWADVALRLHSLLADLAEREAGRRVLLVCHDAVVLMLRHILEELDESALLAVHRAEGPLRNASVSEWRLRDGRLRPVCFNDTAHLA
ncbi:histidine phosphatase family protein [Peterkaempfera bronchialis]|uniref:histidine phosphatase family protein n=1 Tax=Peterkaempfera bronchialis TaxID=2126346 RepID=UPI003C2F0293